ncbi:MAG: tetratricopeptide repeat protein [Thermoanaerobaculia bacterium]
MQHLLLATFLLFSPPTDDAVERMKGALRAGKVDEAIKAGEDASKGASDRSVLQQWLGKAYAVKAQQASLFTALGWAKKSRTAFERAFELDASNTDAGLDLLEFYVLAPGVAGGSKEKAKALAQKIGTDGSSRRSLASAMVLQSEKMSSEAEAAYRKALESDALDDRAFIGFVNFCASEKRFAEAVEWCKGRLAARPDEPLPNYAIGKLVVLWGQEYEQGLACLDKFLAKAAKPDGPTWADARFRKGQIFEKLGRKEEARAEFKSALQLNPGHGGATRELKKL